MIIKKHIILRADASAEIGYGHFVRTLALADMLGHNFHLTLATRHPTSYQIEQIQGVCDSYVVLGENHFDEFLDLLTGEEIVVLDNYFFDTAYQRKIKQKGCPLVCIDDMHERHYLADVVINHALNDPSLFSVEPYTQLCLGLDWALLRRAFGEVSTSAQREAGHWVVAFGGVDKNDLTGQVSAILSQRSDIRKITAVVGDAYTKVESLRGIEKVDVRSKLSASEMAHLFCNVECAVLPTSTICIEAIACGCPVAAGYYVDNQEESYHQFSDLGYITPLGDLNATDLCERLQKIEPRTQTYRNSIDRAKNYRDLFIYLILKVIPYTQLTPEESRKVWQERNAPEIRQFMTNPAPFDFNSHEAFIEHLKSDRTKRYWALFVDTEFVGGYSVVSAEGESAERGIFLARQYWGSGYAELIEHKMDSELRELGIVKLTAQVQRENLRSMQYHKKRGYRLVGQDDVNFILERTIEP